MRIKLGDWVYHSNFGVGKILMYSDSKDYVLVKFSVIMWVSLHDVKKRVLKSLFSSHSACAVS